MSFLNGVMPSIAARNALPKMSVGFVLSLGNRSVPAEKRVEPTDTGDERRVDASHQLLGEETDGERAHE